MTRKQIYEIGLTMYGHLPLLVLIQVYTHDENFEECGLILEVLKEQSIKHGVQYPTRLSPEEIVNCDIQYMLKAIVIEDNIKTVVG